MGLAPTKQIFTVDEYLARERAAENRCEYFDGELYAMPRESAAHEAITANIAAELNQQLNETPCAVFAQNMKVRAGDPPAALFSLQGFYAYPDLAVVCGEPLYHDECRDALLNPTVIFEILSPATEVYDRGRKFARYRENLPSLIDYLLVAQDLAFIDHNHKDPDGRWARASSKGLPASLYLSAIDCSLRLADIYQNIKFPA